MTAPEKTVSSETDILQSPEISSLDISVDEFQAKDFEEFSNLVVENARFIRSMSGVLDPYGIRMWAEDIKDGAPPNGVTLRMIRYKGEIAGCIVTGEMDEKTVDISYFLGEKFTRKGIGTTAVGTVINQQNGLGKDVIAEVKGDDYPSIKLLGKLGIERDHIDFVERFHVYKSPAKNNQLKKTEAAS